MFSLLFVGRKAMDIFMARKGRVQSTTGIYHILLRGVNLLFSQSGDYDEFTAILKRYSDAGDVSIYSYSLLNNRIHLVISASDDIGKALKPICTSYARYFNRTHGGSGKLFYDRFKSEPIDSDTDLCGVVSFVNSISARIGDDYPYCSLSSDGTEICSRSGKLTKAQLLSTKITDMYIEDYDCLTQKEINQYIFDLCGIMPKDFKNLSPAELTIALATLTKKRWIAKTKLYSILGIKKAQPQKPTAPKTAVPKQKPAPKQEEQKQPEPKRELSVWLL